MKKYKITLIVVLVLFALALGIMVIGENKKADNRRNIIFNLFRSLKDNQTESERASLRAQAGRAMKANKPLFNVSFSGARAVNMDSEPELCGGLRECLLGCTIEVCLPEGELWPISECHSVEISATEAARWFTIMRCSL